MIKIHRWFDNYWGWSKELVLQNIKNVVKYWMVRMKRGKGD